MINYKTRTYNINGFYFFLLFAGWIKFVHSPPYGYMTPDLDFRLYIFKGLFVETSI